MEYFKARYYFGTNAALYLKRVYLIVSLDFKRFTVLHEF